MKEIYENNNLKKSSKCWLIVHYTGDQKCVCVFIDGIDRQLEYAHQVHFINCFECLLFTPHYLST